MCFKKRYFILSLIVLSLFSIAFFAWRVFSEKYLFGIVGLVSNISLFALLVIVLKQRDE
jgi:hypothetical protein